MGQPFDHGPAGGIGKSRESCVQIIHNHMVVYWPWMSTVDFGVPRNRRCLGSGRGHPSPQRSKEKKR